MSARLVAVAGILAAGLTFVIGLAAAFHWCDVPCVESRGSSGAPLDDTDEAGA